LATSARPPYDARMIQPQSSLADPRGAEAQRWLLLATFLGGLCLLVRLPGLMAMPIFGDEAIYLRWAQLVRGDGVGIAHPWVSLADPKPPLHFWLLAIVLHFTADPLLAARLLSVLSGAFATALMLPVGMELGRLIAHGEKMRARVNGHLWGLTAAVLSIFCPFLAFYQRLASADSLFVAESLLILWLSLRWGRLAALPPDMLDRSCAWYTALFLGPAMGAALMTRQGLSYTILAMPVVAWLIHANRFDNRQVIVAAGPLAKPTFMSELRGLGRFTVRFLPRALQLSLALLIAAAVWSPYLLAELKPRALAVRNEVVPASTANATAPAPTAEELRAELRRRILYQDQFTQGSEQRFAIVGRNAFWTFVPRWQDGQPVSGWLFFYLTPIIYGLSLAGLLYLAARHWRLFALLSIWALAMLGPVILLGNVVYSRYILAGVPPLLFAAGYLLTDATAGLLQQAAARPLHAWSAAAILWSAAILWPILDLGKQSTRWHQQTLTASIPGVRGDQYQYVHGWTSGLATKKAITYIQNLAKNGPLAIITDNAWGTPADAFWVYLTGNPNVILYYTDDRAIFRPGRETGSVLLKDNKWLFPAERQVWLPTDIPVLYITNDPVHSGNADIPAETYFHDANPNLRKWATFYGIDGAKGEGVTLLSLALRPLQSASRSAVNSATAPRTR
jgi:4-amino-4-deoxy-L-arabinose transferase-like glycosyltransferase